MTSFTVILGDSGYDIHFTLQDANGNVFDLTGIDTLLFKAQKANLTSLKFSGVMTPVLPLTAGICKYVVASGNFDSAGLYSAEIEAKFTGGKTITFSDIQIEVEPKIPY